MCNRLNWSFRLTCPELLQQIEVREGQTVKAGDVLFRLDARQFQIAVDNATALLAETGLTLELYERRLQANVE